MKSTTTSCRSIGRVALELDELRRCDSVQDAQQFPSTCRAMLYELPGNSFCFDCSDPAPRWASVTYGILLCVQCSGRHRSYGVQTSFVRSIDMDAWSHTQVLAMLEGGNRQLHEFFERHHMGNNDDPTNTMTDTRYRTKAAHFYSTHLKRHAEAVAEAGPYKGREAARRKHHHTHQAKQTIHHAANSNKHVNGQIADQSTTSNTNKEYRIQQQPVAA